MAEILGAFEQAVLLAIVRLGDEAYGRAVLKEVQVRLDREVAAGAVHATLDRLETKGRAPAPVLSAAAEGRTRPQRGSCRSGGVVAGPEVAPGRFGMTPTPPDWAEALLPLVLKADNAASVTGDLLEEYRASIHPARGQQAADRWYARQALGYLVRSTVGWAALFGGAAVARGALDWLVPTTDFYLRSAVSTSLGVGTLMAAGLWAGWRSASFAAGTLAGLATAGFGAVISISGAALLLAAAHDPRTMAAIRDSGGLAEVFTLPFMLMVPGAIVGTVAGAAGATARAFLSPGSASPTPAP
jgi:hypothetical protein